MPLCCDPCQTSQPALYQEPPFKSFLLTKSAQQGPGQKTRALLWSNRLKLLRSKNKMRVQRSESHFGRRSDGVSESRRFKKNRRRERYEVRDDDGRRSCFSAEKPRRLQRAPGTLPRAAFQVLLLTTYTSCRPDRTVGPAACLWGTKKMDLRF